MQPMSNSIKIRGRVIGVNHPVFIVAEISANHNQSYKEAVKIIHAAKEAGADAIKLQTYTPDTITIDSDQPFFKVGGGTLWDGKTLHELYGEAYTPWDWQPKLKKLAEQIGLCFFSTPFDFSAVDFLEKIDVPCWKVASFEIVDLPLIEKIGATGKPIIMSTGMASLAEIEEAVECAHNSGATQIALLKCTSAYPALPEEMNLRTLPHLAQAFQSPVGLSDHTTGIAVPLAAVALGACIIEKHFTLSRSIQGPDSQFSLEPNEFAAMVEAIRTVEKAVGQVHYGLNAQESKSAIFRRSLFFISDVKAGQRVTAENVRSIRPGHGLSPKYLKNIMGRRVVTDVRRGTPVCWDILGGSK